MFQATARMLRVVTWDKGPAERKTGLATLVLTLGNADQSLVNVRAA